MERSILVFTALFCAVSGLLGCVEQYSESPAQQPAALLQIELKKEPRSVQVAKAGHEKPLKRNTPLRTLPARLFGVTVDDIEPLEDILDSLRKLKQPAIRVVFDQGMPATYYRSAVAQMGSVGYLMGQLLDSSAMKNIETEQYLSRTREYLNELSGKIDLWEIGNEINGEWLGETEATVAKMTGAYDLVKEAGELTALTLHYNIGCTDERQRETFRWASANVPERMLKGLDYVFLSYYEEDCNNRRPNWERAFAELAELFPNSKIGFGEIGAKKSENKLETLRRYYRMPISAPRFVGGYFWWYFVSDMTPSTKSLLSELRKLQKPIDRIK